MGVEVGSSHLLEPLLTAYTNFDTPNHTHLPPTYIDEAALSTINRLLEV